MGNDVVKLMLITLTLFAYLPLSAQEEEEVDLKKLSDAYYNEMMNIKPEEPKSDWELMPPYGIQIGTGLSLYQYFGNTNKYIGNHNSFNLEVGAIVHGFTLSSRIKFGGIKPKNEFEYQDQVLSPLARLTSFKSDFFISYDYLIFERYTIKPSVGVVMNSFHVINENEIGQTFETSKTTGFFFDVVFESNFKIKADKSETAYSSIYLKIGASATNFKDISEDLGYGYGEIALGARFKAYIRKKRQ